MWPNEQPTSSTRESRAPRRAQIGEERVEEVPAARLLEREVLRRARGPLALDEHPDDARAVRRRYSRPPTVSTRRSPRSSRRYGAAHLLRITAPPVACLHRLLQDDEDARGQPARQRAERRLARARHALEQRWQRPPDLEAEGRQVGQADEGLRPHEVERQAGLAEPGQEQVRDRGVALEGGLVVRVEGRATSTPSRHSSWWK